MKKCYYCGADVPDQSKFCPKCGKSMEITQDLIDRAKANDPEAQTELYERTYKTVYSRIRAKVPDNDTAMDIMQESYLSAFTNLDQLQTAATFPSWLLTIASRQVCTWYRKNGKENENIQMSRLEYENDDTISDEDDLLGQPEYREDFSPDESLDRAETGRLLSEILDTLPEDQRIILIMRYYDEMSLQEISDELGVNLSTVKTRLTAGKKKVEAKVLELEKSGTKLYSLGPMAFLVFLLHHAELFAPAISANTVIGLTAAGAAGAGAGGAAAVHVTAGVAAKTAVAAAAKGVSVKVVAIVAAAVIVVGGGTTAAVVATNNARATSDTAATETTGNEPAGSSQEVVVGLTPTDREETEPEASEEPEVAEGSEEQSEEESDQQEPEPAGSEENQDEAILENTVEPPSYDVVYDMTAPLSYWVANVVFDYDTANSSLGKINLNTNRAVELAGMATYNDENDRSTDMSAGQVETNLRKLFGSQYQLSDFTNTYSNSDETEYNSDFSTEYPKYIGLGWLYQAGDSNFHIEFCPARYDPIDSNGVTVKSIVLNDDSSCTATVEYDIDNSRPYDDFYNWWSLDIYFDLIPDDGATYGWAIQSFSLSDEYDDYCNVDFDYY